MQHEKGLNLLKKDKNIGYLVSACMSCHYTVCPLYKYDLLSLKWDKMGGLFTGCWCCYLINQLQLGLFSPRKIGSTFEMNIWIKTHTHILFLSLTHTDRLGLWHFKTVTLSVKCTPQNLLLTQKPLCLTWRSKIWPDS